MRRTRLAARLAWIALGVALALGSGCAHTRTSTLQGSIEPAPGRRAGTSVENTIVYIVGEGSEAAAAPGTAFIDEDTTRLRPPVLAVALGTRVRFRSRDGLYHKPFSISPSQPFHAGAVSPSESRSVVFDHAGPIQVFCELHPTESAFIYVVPTSRFTHADPHGRFHFWGVPPGAYTLRTWHPERGETSQAVMVPPHGQLRVTVTD